MDSVSVQPNGVASFEGSASKIEQGNGIIQTGGVFTMRDYNINQNHYHNAREPVLSPDEDAKEALIKSLEFQGMNERFESVQDNTRHTCQWLLETLGFCEWQTSFHTKTSRRLLWIKGQPGAGKSTYMKFAVRHARSSGSFKEDLILVHFFNARAPNELAKSTEGMYRTILIQILRELAPELVHKLALRFTTEHLWKLETLSSLFRDVLREHNNRPVTCFIDALDECGEDQIRAMVRSFRDLADEEPTNLQFRACFASRYYPNVTMPDDVAIDFRLEQQPGHFEDIDIYIARHLHVSGSRIAEIIRQEVRKKARGSFIWCRLVIDILNKECDRGGLNQERILQKKLETLPEDLRSIFCEILGLREGTERHPNVEAMTLCMQWVLFSAIRDIGPLWWAIQRVTRPEAETEDLEDEFQSHSQESLGLCILDLCKGLLEVVTEGTRIWEFGQLQVIHESVRDFLLGGGLGQLMRIRGSEQNGGRSAHEAEALSHERIKELSFDEGFRRHDELFKKWPEFDGPYDEVANFRAELRRKNPLLLYSLFSVHHANEAHRQGSSRYNLDQTRFLEELGRGSFLDRCRKLHSVLSMNTHSETVSLTDILIQEDASDLLRAYYCGPGAIQRANRLSLHQHLKNFKVSAAVLQAVFDIYLDRHESGSPRRAALQRLADRVDVGGLKEYSFEDADDVVLSLGGMDPNLGVLLVGALLPSTTGAEDVLATWEKTTKSGPATPRTFASFLSLVLARVTPSEAAHILDLGMTLCWASERGDQALIRLLLKKFNAPCSAQRESGETPLHLAVKSEHISVVGSLISRADIDPNARDVRGNTALHYAVYRGGKVDMIEKLSGSGWVDVNAKNNNGETALHLAVERDVTVTTMQALLSIPKVDANAKNSMGDTPLHYAVYHRRSTAIQALLANDQVDVNATSNTGDAPLHTAVRAVRGIMADAESATKKLLATGKVNLNARNNDNETAKDIAQRCKHGPLVTLLTDWASRQDAAPESASSSPTRHSESSKSPTLGSSSSQS